MKIDKLLILLIFLVTPVMKSSDIEGLNRKISLNPEFKIKQVTVGKIIAYKYSGGTRINLYFYEIEADILLAAIRKLTIRELITRVSEKYDISEEESRRKVKHGINILTEWKILLPPERS